MKGGWNVCFLRCWSSPKLGVPPSRQSQSGRERVASPPGHPSPTPLVTWSAGHRHPSSRMFSCPSPSSLTSYVASWLGSGSCRGPRAALRSSVRVSSLPASASICFSRAWCEVLRPSCRSQRIMCIWAERGQRDRWLGETLPVPWSKAAEPAFTKSSQALEDYPQ